MEDEELLAAVGRVVVESAALEYFIAVLVAVAEGHRGQDIEHHALALVKKTGRAMTELESLVGARPERHDLRHLWHDAKAVLDDRNVIARAIPLGDAQAGHVALMGFHPRTGSEIRLTTIALLGHIQDIRIASRRFHEAIAAETGRDVTP